LSQNNSPKQISFFSTFTVPPPVERGGRDACRENGSQKIILKNKSLFLAHLLYPLQLKEEGVTHVVNMVAEYGGPLSDYQSAGIVQVCGKERARVWV